MENRTDFNAEYLEHLIEPKNYGLIENYSAKGIAKSADESEYVEIFLKIEDETINDIKYQAIGCTTTIVGGSIFTSNIKGETIEEAISVTNDVLEKLKNAISEERICGEMVAKSFLSAIDNYRNNITSNEEEVVIVLDENCPIED